jgi:molybdate transport system ATP-binding protein
VSLSLRFRFADRDVDVALDVPEGQTVALLGPNGSGKTTLLLAVAGLLRPDTGVATVDGTTLVRVGAEPEVWLPPPRRGTALLSQDPMLFPHLDVLENVAFGPRSAGRHRHEAREAARHWLAEVDAAELADRRPSQLSGGQAQRVAVARALAAEPRVLLLDEPMAALDAAVVPAMRRTLRRVLAGRTALVVTHEALDALVLADRAVVLERGRVVDDGPVRHVLSQPRSRFGAHVAGLNLVNGTAVGGSSVRTTGGHTVVGVAESPIPDGQEAVAVFSPAAVAIYRTPPAGSPRNQFHVLVDHLDPRGPLVRVRAGDLSSDVTPAAVADLDLEPGSRVTMVVKASEVTTYAL